jgi:hypothetical protein
MDSDSFLYIPDISGFTEFVNETEISHSRHVVSELLEAIIGADSLGMKVTEIEGDAVVFFLPNQKPALTDIIEQARRTFEAFHAHLKRYERDRICPCGACRSAHELTLKMVAHGGPIETIKVQEFEKPYGSDVILAHRLLKNDVPDTEYLLVTQDLERGTDSLPPWAEMVPGESTYENIGPVQYHHIPLGPLRATIPEPSPLPAPTQSSRPITREVFVPLPPEEAYELISNFDQRLLWNRGVDDLVYDQDRVNRMGTRHQCLIDGSLLDFESVTRDFGPNRLVYGERILGKTPVIDPTLYYILEAQGEGTRVCVEVHYRPEPFPRSLLAMVFRFGMSRRLRPILQALGELGGTPAEVKPVE